VFYQSRELLEKAAGILGSKSGQLARDRHIVLPHGIPEPPAFSREEARNRIREAWGVRNDEVLVFYLGRIVRQKGILELLEALRLAVTRDAKIKGILVGSKLGFDETSLVDKKLQEIPRLRERVLLLPACTPDSVWENLCAADIFAFPSHHEGMPNSLLEAMAMGVPAIAFAIPPVIDLEAGRGGVSLIPPLDSSLFADEIVRLAASPAERIRISRIAKAEIMDRFMVKKNMARALVHLDRMIRTREKGTRTQAKGVPGGSHCGKSLEP
jgi:glycosyltransferase involved in cell wall biosynthesis